MISAIRRRDNLLKSVPLALPVLSPVRLLGDICTGKASGTQSATIRQTELSSAARGSVAVLDGEPVGVSLSRVLVAVAGVIDVADLVDQDVV
jgi:hypothetical protein